MANETVFKRYVGNPIVPRAPSPGQHHPQLGNRQERSRRLCRGVPRGRDQHGLRSPRRVQPDGIDWAINPDPIHMLSNDPEVFVSKLQLRPSPHAVGGTYYLTWCNAGPQGPKIGFATTKDFETFTQGEDLLPPANRNCVVFPARSTGNTPSSTGRPTEATRRSRHLLRDEPGLCALGLPSFRPRSDGGWQSLKTGPGPAPIETDEGWLLIYHGVWRSCNGYLYYIGGALLDLDEPWKVLYRTRDYS